MKLSQNPGLENGLNNYLLKGSFLLWKCLHFVCFYDMLTCEVNVMKTVIKEKIDLDAIVETLKNDGVVAFPTETVFGLGVIYNSNKAIDRLIKAKNRDMSKRFTLMLDSKNKIEDYAIVSLRERKIIEAFMPGDLTIILNSKDNKQTIGIRIPDDDFVCSLISKCQIPLYVTSANISHQPSALNDKEALTQLDGRIDMIVKGECKMNQASTVVDLTGDTIKILRQGRITLEMIEEVIR